MTSTANPPNSNPAPNLAATAAPSYASAAGATKKPASNLPPVVVGSAAAPQHVKTSSASPVNGRPSIPPAVPAVSGAVVHGTTLNGGAGDHSRKSSVTIGANAPGVYGTNGGPVGGAKSHIQFGFTADSPAIVHSTPQPGASTPIPIPGANPRLTSPAHSPSPIPQPSASGGRPPSGLQQPTGQMTFGSLDGDRHMRQPSVPSNPNLPTQPAHLRRESAHSVSSTGDMASQGPPGQGPNRGGFGRARGFNPTNPPYNGPHNNQQPMGFPPQNQYRNGPGQGRAGIPPNYPNPQRQMQPQGFPNSPQPNRSPAPVSSIPNTPVPPAAVQPAMPMGQPYYAGPPIGPQAGMPGYGYPPPQPGMDYSRPMQMAYPNYHVPYPAQTNSPAYPQHFVPPPYHGGTSAMSRTPSHSDKPNPTGVPPGQPMIVSGASQAQNIPPKAGPNSNIFSKPKGAGITIKNDKGEEVDFSQLRPPSTPASGVQPSKTPPIVKSAPTPPPQSSGLSHTRTESQVQSAKTKKEIQDELREKIAQATKGTSDEKATEEAARAAAEKAAAEKAAAEKAAAEEKAKAEAEEKAREEARLKAEKEAEAAAKAAAEAKQKEDAEAAAKAAQAAAEAKKKQEEEEEFERMVREMEEEEARRAAEEEEYQKKKKEQVEEEKKAKAANAAEEDRKLREQEREMERLEEEKERRRRQDESPAKGLSVAELLAQSRSSPAASTPTKETDSPKLGSVTDKLASLSIEGDSKPTTPTGDASGAKAGSSDKPRSKPAALNLTPITTRPVEAPQPSAQLQSLKSARFLTAIHPGLYPEKIHSPNPALNPAATRRGRTFKYDAQFLLQFQTVFTEQPSMEFESQVKSLIGDPDGSRSASARTPATGSGRQNSRTGGPVVPAMGSFGALGGRTLPPGTTSEQRLAMSQGAMPRPNMGGALGSFQRSGGFPVSAAMTRNPSSSNMNMPNSPRQGSRPGRDRSRRDNFGAKEAQNAKTMPLTHGQEVKALATTTSGWKPSNLGNKAAQAPTAVSQGGHTSPEMVQRKVNAALNKMTPENFDRISLQILEIAGQSKFEKDGRTLRQVIQLTFEKATDEAHWASMYAKFCKRMLDTMSPEIQDDTIKDKFGNVVSGGNLFRKYLLNRCQEEFEKGWKAAGQEGKEGDEKSLEAAMMSDDYYVAAAAKRRGLGLVQFIGELYKLGMLTERIMHECVRKLVDYTDMPDEAEIESLSKLLRTIGATLDNSEKGRPMMDAYFQRIQNIIDLPTLPNRLKFMLMDVVDLRRSGWVSKEQNKGPKTLEEVRVEAAEAQAQKAQEAARNQRGPGGPRPALGRGDARAFSSNFGQPASNQVGMDDLRRLKGSAGRATSGNVTLGPTSMFASRSNSGRRLGTGPGGSLGRAGEDSGASSRTGTPPTRDSAPHSNAFSLLANMESENPASPPSTAASPSLPKVVPDQAAAGDDKKESV